MRLMYVLLFSNGHNLPCLCCVLLCSQTLKQKAGPPQARLLLTLYSSSFEVL